MQDEEIQVEEVEVEDVVEPENRGATNIFPALRKKVNPLNPNRLIHAQVSKWSKTLGEVASMNTMVLHKMNRNGEFTEDDYLLISAYREKARQMGVAALTTRTPNPTKGATPKKPLRPSKTVTPKKRVEAMDFVDFDREAILKMVERGDFDMAFAKEIWTMQRQLRANGLLKTTSRFGD